MDENIFISILSQLLLISVMLFGGFIFWKKGMARVWHQMNDAESCIHCRYSLRGVADANKSHCPECGVDQADTTKIRLDRIGRWFQFIGAALILCAALFFVVMVPSLLAKAIS